MKVSASGIVYALQGRMRALKLMAFYVSETRSIDRGGKLNFIAQAWRLRRRVSELGFGISYLPECRDLLGLTWVVDK
jgi:hypothetical protein